VTERQYRERFEEACAFLRGERPRYLKDIREKMELLSADLDFEKATALRDTLLLLEATVKQRARVASTPEMKQQECKEGVKELRRILGLKHIPRVIEAYDVSSISGTYCVASMVCSVDGMPQRNRYRRFRIRSVSGNDDPRMMAEVFRRRFGRLTAEGGQLPDLVLVDGGMAQLRAARSELKKLGLDRVPIAGLAKRFEDIYVEESRRPLRLHRDSRGLKVLQRIRDEAHRFALTYHRYLRSRRVRESALDNVPGIGSKRKQLLLSHFGSVRRLATAAENQIAEVPGIGYETARVIRQSLSRKPPRT